MIFRQLFDSTSGTYTYLLASRRGGEALIIDPVIEKVDRYLQLISELDLRLVKAVDTHLHADHVTGLGALRDRTHCITVMGEQRADSSGRRNELFVGRSQKFVKCLCGRSPFERLARSCVEGGRHGGDLVSTMRAQVCALWKVLT